MTTTKSLRVDSTDQDAPVRPSSKSVLFCPECGHRNRLTGDWIADAADGTETLHCPVCQTVVSER